MEKSRPIPLYFRGKEMNRALKEAFYGTSDPIMTPNKQMRVRVEGGNN